MKNHPGDIQNFRRFDRPYRHVVEESIFIRFVQPWVDWRVDLAYPDTGPGGGISNPVNPVTPIIPGKRRVRLTEADQV